MSTTPAPSPPPPVGRRPLHVVHVLSGGSTGTGVHVRSLATGLVARGLRVTVCAPSGAELSYGFTAAGAHFAPISALSEPEAVAALRRVCEEADLVHAHGLGAGLLAALALGRRRQGRHQHRQEQQEEQEQQGRQPQGQRGGRRPERRRATRSIPLVVTWHTREHAQGPRAPLARMLERRVARSASVVLGATSDLVGRARLRGARDARLAPVATPGACAPRAREPWGEHEACEPWESLGARGPWDTSGLPGGDEVPDEQPGEWLRHKVRAEVGAVDRPLVFSVGRLEAQQGYDTALTAARAWRHLDPPPLLAIAGEGRERAALQQRIDAEDLPVRLLGRRDDAFQLLAGADVALLSSRWEARSLLAQEALHAGVPLVATAVGGVPELVGDGALLVRYGDADGLAAAVLGLLADPERGAELAAAGRARAASWPTEGHTVAQVLSVYDELTSATAG